MIVKRGEDVYEDMRTDLFTPDFVQSKQQFANGWICCSNMKFRTRYVLPA